MENDIEYKELYYHYCINVIKDKNALKWLKSYSTDEDNMMTIELWYPNEFINKIKTDIEFSERWGSKSDCKN